METAGDSDLTGEKQNEGRWDIYLYPSHLLFLASNFFKYVFFIDTDGWLRKVEWKLLYRSQNE